MSESLRQRGPSVIISADQKQSGKPFKWGQEAVPLKPAGGEVRVKLGAAAPEASENIKMNYVHPPLCSQSPQVCPRVETWCGAHTSSMFL